jgi:integrase
MASKDKCHDAALDVFVDTSQSDWFDGQTGFLEDFTLEAIHYGLIEFEDATGWFDGGGQEDSGERSVIPIAIVFVIADILPRRYRALVLLATFAQLRLGELAALTRDRIDLATCQVRVTDAKSRAGNRTVTFPAEIVSGLREHLCIYAAPGAKGLVFIGPMGGILRRNNFNPIWRKACVAAGVPDAHFHDLRHTGGTLAATTGATIKELMARLGHSSPRAAMIYQHATRESDRTIAEGLGQLLRDARQADQRERSGP